MGKEKFIPIIAIIVLLIGAGSSVYVYGTHVDINSDTNTGINSSSEIIIVDGKEYTIGNLFSSVEPRVFDSLNCSGIALDNLIVTVGVECPSCNMYKVVGADGYCKTVTWENMQDGLLTNDREVVFSDLPKAFDIKDVVKIEVIQSE